MHAKERTYAFLILPLPDVDGDDCNQLDNLEQGDKRDAQVEAEGTTQGGYETVPL